MRPIKTEDSNSRLVIPEEEHLPESERHGDVPVEKLFFRDDDGETKPGFESTWQPDLGERRALANGAPVILRVWGEGHPLSRVEVGEPDEESMERLVTIRETVAAANRFFESLAARWEELDGEEKLGPEEIPIMFQAALHGVIEGGEFRPGAQTNGHGPRASESEGE